MTGKTHLVTAGSLAFALSAALSLPKEATTIAVAMSCIGGLLPDIDHKNSTISKSMTLASFLARGLSSHRGMFHSPALYLLLGGLLRIFVPAYFSMWVVPALFGVGTHLFLDMLNPTGIPLLWPLSKTKTHILRIKTGGWGDKAMCAIMPMIAIVAVVRLGR